LVKLRAVKAYYEQRIPLWTTGTFQEPKLDLSNVDAKAQYSDRKAEWNPAVSSSKPGCAGVTNIVEQARCMGVR
jgi:hypothetical protein